MMVDPAFGHWLAGFIDGEGCFAINCSQSGTAHRRVQIKFVLDLRADDRPIVEEIRARTGIKGSIRHRESYGDGNRRAQVSWHVNARGDLARLVQLLDTYPLRAKKRRDYEIWKRAVHASAGNRKGPGSAARTRQSAIDWQLRRLARELRVTRGYPEDGEPQLESTVSDEQLVFGVGA